MSFFHDLSRRLRRWHTLRELREGHIPWATWKPVEATPLIRPLNRVERARLRELASRLLAEKQLLGSGIELTPTMRAYIGAEASLPLLGLPDDLDRYDNWHTLVVRPTPWKAPMNGPALGPLTEQRDVTLAGVTSLQWPVIIDWQNARPHRLGHHARQVIIHELAHKIDLQVDDAANGYPPLHADMDSKAWFDAFQQAFDDLNRCIQRPRCHPPINAYAASAPGEFFAVATEYFFAAPWTLWHGYPAVYEQLRQFYRQDPRQRFPGPRR